MKILLVIPKKNSRAILPAPDVGMAYIARAALNAGAQVEVLDAHKENINPDSLLGFLQEKSFDLIGFKCLSTDFFTVGEYCRAIKKHTPHVLTVMGGCHPSALPEETMLQTEVDYIIRGEGELGISSLIQKLTRHQGRIPEYELSKIPNLVYRNRNNKVVLNPMTFVQDLDTIGFPAWHLFNIEDYPELPGSGGRFLPIITSRGCPSRCTFCCSNAIHGKKVRTQSPENVIKEIKWLLQCYKLQKISIFDNNFTFYKEHAMKFCKLYQQNDLPMSFDIPQGIRIDNLDQELLMALDKAGCDYIGIGIESGDQKTLDLVRKGTSISEIREKINFIKKYTKIMVIGFFIIGFPFETEADVKNTINFALNLKLDYAAFTIFTPFPGSFLFNQMVKELYFSVDTFNWKNLTLDKTTYHHRNISQRRLKMLQRIAYFRFYFRRSRIGFFYRIIMKEHSLISYLKRLKSILYGQH